MLKLSAKLHQNGGMDWIATWIVLALVGRTVRSCRNGRREGTIPPNCQSPLVQVWKARIYILYKTCRIALGYQSNDLSMSEENSNMLKRRPGTLLSKEARHNKVGCRNSSPWQWRQSYKSWPIPKTRCRDPKQEATAICMELVKEKEPKRRYMEIHSIPSKSWFCNCKCYSSCIII